MPMNSMISYGTGMALYNQYKQEMVDLSRKPDNYDAWKEKRIARRQAYIATKENTQAKTEDKE